jgi:hypothetical protein
VQFSKKVIAVKNYIILNYTQIEILRIKTTRFYKHDQTQNKLFDPRIKTQVLDWLKDSLFYILRWSGLAQL